MARYALLISDDPASAAPRRIVTGSDGTVDVRLRPGHYIVESEQAVSLQGKSDQWTQPISVAAGRDARLELNAGNADLAATPEGGASPDLGSVFDTWQGSIVTIWSETGRGLGFLLNTNGLLATTARVVGRSESVEVEISPTAKVAARVVAVDSTRNVAVVWMDPAAAASMRPVRLGYAERGEAPITAGQELLSVGSPLHGRTFMTTATVNRVDTRTIDSDVVVDPGNAGGPVFAATGEVIGITTLGPPREDGPARAGVLRIDEARDGIASATSQIGTGAPPPAAPLAVEPARAFPETALRAALKNRVPNVVDYQAKGADFDVTFITPVMLYSEQDRQQQAERRTHGSGRIEGPAQQLLSTDSFENWAGYVSTFPPVLLIRATPKLVEGFWSVVGRQAAQTQGVRLPAAKHLKDNFLTMRLFCGDTEIAPIHPFKIEHRLSAEENAGESASAIAYEGLYVFAPGAINPQCGPVKLVLFSERAPSKGDTQVVDPRIVQHIWQDFALYRASDR